MKSFVIFFEDQKHHIDYSSEMINDAHIITIFLHDQKLINIAGERFNMIKLLGGIDAYQYDEPLNARGRDVKKIIALELNKIFRKKEK